jgi:P2 family phage contractile tail tube protein
MSLLINEAFTMFVGDDGPDNSKHANIVSIKLPTLEEFSQSHFGGGAVGEVNIGNLGLKALEITFKTFGIDPQINSNFGLSDRGIMPFTIYNAIRNKDGSKPIERKIIVRGRLGRVDEDELKRGEAGGHDHTIHEILHYEVYFDGKEMYYYDYLSTTWRVNGGQGNADIRRILRIPGAA